MPEDFPLKPTDILDMHERMTSPVMELRVYIMLAHGWPFRMWGQVPPDHPTIHRRFTSLKNAMKDTGPDGLPWLALGTSGIVDQWTTFRCDAISIFAGRQEERCPGVWMWSCDFNEDWRAACGVKIDAPDGHGLPSPRYSTIPQGRLNAWVARRYDVPVGSRYPSKKELKSEMLVEFQRMPTKRALEEAFRVAVPEEAKRSGKVRPIRTFNRPE